MILPDETIEVRLQWDYVRFLSTDSVRAILRKNGLDPTVRFSFKRDGEDAVYTGLKVRP